MTSNGVDTVDTESLPVDDLHVVEPRAAGLEAVRATVPRVGARTEEARAKG